MFSNSIKKERFISILVIIVSLPLSIVGAASNSLPVGTLFGFALALGIDRLISSFKHGKTADK